MSTLGFLIIGLSLFFVVQARHVYPDLLLARILFSMGGAAASCMVTAILPLMAVPSQRTMRAGGPRDTRRSSQDMAFTPAVGGETSPASSQYANDRTSTSRMAGFVGLATGVGALLSLFGLLRLPPLLQHQGSSPARALTDTYYVVACTSIVLSILCAIGLRNIDQRKKRVLSTQPQQRLVAGRSSHQNTLLQAVKFGFTESSIGLAYIGSVVARTSSVLISTFIPLFVNAYYLKSGLCDIDLRDPQKIKQDCRQAYLLAAQLSGTSQTAALAFALCFGLAAMRRRRLISVLGFAALTGLAGYLALGFLSSPMTQGENGTPFIFLIMIMLGFNQIGSIICSLSLLGNCVLADKWTDIEDSQHQDIDRTPLISRPAEYESKESLKGSIAGIYSFWGGLGILVLTKVGGLLFDELSPTAPFYIMAIFNAVLLLSCFHRTFWKTGSEEEQCG